MKIKYISDLHHEFGSEPEWMISSAQEREILVIAGDLAVGAKNVYKALKRYDEMFYRHIIYVAGNHEYYGTSIEQFNTELQELLQGESRIHFLNNDSVTIDDVTFIGTTLWTNFRNDGFAMHSAKEMISDFHHIKRFSPAYSKGKFEHAAEYIKRVYETTPGKKVIVTHFLPAVECISPRFQSSALNEYFANDLGSWIETLSDTTWIFGHTHDRINIKLGDTRLLCNPYGYFGYEVNPEFNVLEEIYV